MVVRAQRHVSSECERRGLVGGIRAGDFRACLAGEGAEGRSDFGERIPDASAAARQLAAFQCEVGRRVWNSVTALAGCFVALLARPAIVVRPASSRIALVPTGRSRVACLCARCAVLPARNAPFSAACGGNGRRPVVRPLCMRCAPLRRAAGFERFWQGALGYNLRRSISVF